jgi:hypothetical protein
LEGLGIGDWGLRDDGLGVEELGIGIGDWVFYAYY